MMLSNSILRTIQDRRSIYKFKSKEIEHEKIDAIIEAARWAPSWINTQPWHIILIKNKETKHQLSKVVGTLIGIKAAHYTRIAIEEAPIIFIITVDTKKDPYHCIEDGVAATQNMALASHSLGLASYWIGVFDISGETGSIEEQIKKLLNIPGEHRVISILPVGIADMKSVKKDRKETSEFIYHEKFGKK